MTLTLERGSRAPAWLRPRAEVLALASILLGAIAQLLLKDALLHWDGRHSNPSGLVRPLAGVMLGLLVYATGTVFWWRAVSRASISYLYPLTASSYALVAFGGRLFFGEMISPGRWMGIGVICMGVALLAFSQMRGES